MISVAIRKVSMRILANRELIVVKGQMKIPFSIALSVAIAASCQQVPETNSALNNKRITLDLGDFTKHSVDTSVIHQPVLVNLELTTHSQIMKIQKLVVTAHHIVVLDEPNAQSVFIFDRAGKFLKKIHRPGKGPGEFYFLTDMDVDKSADNLYLLDVGGAKMLTYNLNGEFISEHKFGFKTRRFSRIDSAQFAFDQGSRHNPDSEGAFNYRLLGIDFEEKDTGHWFHLRKRTMTVRGISILNIVCSGLMISCFMFIHFSTAPMK